MERLQVLKLARSASRNVLPRLDLSIHLEVRRRPLHYISREGKRRLVRTVNHRNVDHGAGYSTIPLILRRRRKLICLIQLHFGQS